MTTTPRAASRRRFLAGALASVSATAGCVRNSPSAPRVVTIWSAQELALIGLEQPFRIIRPREPLSPLQSVALGIEADLVVGGAIDEYRRAANSGLFRELAAGAYQVARRASPALLTNGGTDEPVSSGSIGWAALGDPAWDNRFLVASPRHDPFTFAAVRAHLHAKSFGEAYAELVGAFGRARSPARSVRAALAHAAGLDAPHLVGPDAIAEAHDLLALPFTDSGPIYDEGLAVLAAARFPDLGEELRNTRGPTALESAPGFDPLQESLLKDLLGATLVACHAELRRAVHALNRSSARERPAVARARQWLVEAPPWPPASVMALRSRAGGRDLVEELVGQVMRDTESRRALLELFSTPAALIDHEILAGIAMAAGARIASSPRFRTWINAEWTAWAAQRYRRCARLALGNPPSRPEVDVA